MTHWKDSLCAPQSQDAETVSVVSMLERDNNQTVRQKVGVSSALFRTYLLPRLAGIKAYTRAAKCRHCIMMAIDVSCDIPQQSSILTEPCQHCVGTNLKPG